MWPVIKKTMEVLLLITVFVGLSVLMALSQPDPHKARGVEKVQRAERGE